MNTSPLLDKEDLAEEQIRRFILERMPQYQPRTEVAAWKRERQRLRREALSKIYLRGYPAKIVNAKPVVKWGETLRPDDSYIIRKLRYEAYPDYWIPALLYEPARLSGKVPAVLNAMGHHSGGKAVTYQQIRCINTARRGMIALNFEFIGMGELEADQHHNDIAWLDMTGLAGVGLFYLAMRKGLDVMLAHRHADPKRIGMTGLSGGGWQTIVLSALDERVTLSVPVAGYMSARARSRYLGDIGDLEQLPADLTTVLDYPEMTAMLVPRPALIIGNEKDECCFTPQRVKPDIFDPVAPTYEAFRAGRNSSCTATAIPARTTTMGTIDRSFTGSSTSIGSSARPNMTFMTNMKSSRRARFGSACRRGS